MNGLIRTDTGFKVNYKTCRTVYSAWLCLIFNFTLFSLLKVHLISKLHLLCQISITWNNQRRITWSFRQLTLASARHLIAYGRVPTVNCIAVNTENIVNASVANKLLPVKLNKKNKWLSKRTQNYVKQFTTKNEWGTHTGRWTHMEKTQTLNIFRSYKMYAQHSNNAMFALFYFIGSKNIMQTAELYTV